jgi:hypothetical protein
MHLKLIMNNLEQVPFHAITLSQRCVITTSKWKYNQNFLIPLGGSACWVWNYYSTDNIIRDHVNNNISLGHIRNVRIVDPQEQKITVP